MNEFATVGQNGAVLFWLLDETKQQVTLNVNSFFISLSYAKFHNFLFYVLTSITSS